MIASSEYELEPPPSPPSCPSLVRQRTRTHANVRGLFSAKVPNSSFAEVRMGLLIEPTLMEDEDEEQENEKEDERDGEE